MSGRARGLGATAARGALAAASVGYRAAVRLRNWTYDAGWRAIERAAVPVVSVGNLTAGGTGKTPCVEYLARFFRDCEMRVAILSRGYGTESGPNDEALVLEENLPDVPHLQGQDRSALARTAVEELESELLILDDGFQHRRLARDFDLVLVDATNPWGYGWLLPRGLLREPIDALRRAHGAVITRSNQAPDMEVERVVERIRRHNPAAPIARAVHQPAAWRRHGQPDSPIADLAGRTVSAFCGLGNPAAFRATLDGIGCRVADFRTFPDHHAYSRADVADLSRWAERQPSDAAIVTTQKDLVKLRTAVLGGRDLFALRIALEILPGSEADRLHRALRQLTTNLGHRAP